MKRPCFCCEKKIKIEHGSPKNGTAWETNGNYNSCLFDPMGDEYIEIYICDDCLRKKAKFAYYFKLKTIKERFNVKKFSDQLKIDDLAKKMLRDELKKYE